MLSENAYARRIIPEKVPVEKSVESVENFCQPKIFPGFPRNSSFWKMGFFAKIIGKLFPAVMLCRRFSTCQI